MAVTGPDSVPDGMSCDVSRDASRELSKEFRELKFLLVRERQISTARKCIIQKFEVEVAELLRTKRLAEQDNDFAKRSFGEKESQVNNLRVETDRTINTLIQVLSRGENGYVSYAEMDLAELSRTVATRFHCLENELNVARNSAATLADLVEQSEVATRSLQKQLQLKTQETSRLRSELEETKAEMRICKMANVEDSNAYESPNGSIGDVGKSFEVSRLESLASLASLASVASVASLDVSPEIERESQTKTHQHRRKPANKKAAPAGEEPNGEGAEDEARTKKWWKPIQAVNDGLFSLMSAASQELSPCQINSSPESHFSQPSELRSEMPSALPSEIVSEMLRGMKSEMQSEVPSVASEVPSEIPFKQRKSKTTKVVVPKRKKAV